jgi:flagellum-specific peptidoglycan hydrolase FlgJ
MKTYIKSKIEAVKRNLDEVIFTLNELIVKHNIITILGTALSIFFLLLFLLQINDIRVHTETTVVNQKIEFVEGNGASTIKVTPKISQKIAPQSVQAKFIADLTLTAQQEALICGIPPSIKIAQSAIETGWGEDIIATEFNNYFGIKYKDEFSEGVLVSCKANKTTYEFVNGVKVKITSSFAKYDTRWNSMRHHSLFLQNRIKSKYNKGYASMAKLSRTDYRNWAKALQLANYSTNPDYAKNLIRIIEKYDLQKLDVT